MFLIILPAVCMLHLEFKTLKILRTWFLWYRGVHYKLKEKPLCFRVCVCVCVYHFCSCGFILLFKFYGNCATPCMSHYRWALSLQ